MLRFLLVVFVSFCCVGSAFSLDLTNRQISINGSIDVSHATKTAAKLVVMDGQAQAPIYLMIACSRGSAQGVLLLADTIRSLKNPVVAVVQTQIHGAGAALAVLTDRLVMYRSSGLVFHEVAYQGVSKPAPPGAKRKKASTAPKEPSAKAKLLQVVRTDYLARFWNKVASRLKMKVELLNEKLASGGFAMTPRATLKARVAHSVVESLSYAKLSEQKTETKTTTIRKRARTASSSAD